MDMTRDIAPQTQEEQRSGTATLNPRNWKFYRWHHLSSQMLLLLFFATPTSKYNRGLEGVSSQALSQRKIKGKGRGCKRSVLDWQGGVTRQFWDQQPGRLPWCICWGECWVSRECQGRRDWPRGFGSLWSLNWEKVSFGRLLSPHSQFSQGSGCLREPATSCRRPAQQRTMYKEKIENKEIKYFRVFFNIWMSKRVKSYEYWAKSNRI